MSSVLFCFSWIIWLAASIFIPETWKISTLLKFSLFISDGVNNEYTNIKTLIICKIRHKNYNLSKRKAAMKMGFIVNKYMEILHEN
jgi:hypothetical protein